MNPMTEELASLYVLDKLSEDERRLFETQLETDTELVLLVRELETVFEDQIRALPQQKVPNHLLGRIHYRIQKQAPAPDPKPVITISWSTFAGWGTAAALLLGVGLTLLFTSNDQPEGIAGTQPVVLVVGMGSDSSVLELVPSVLPVDESENFVHLAKMAEHFWDHPEQLPDHIGKSPLANTLGSGYAVFDPQNKHGFIAIRKLAKHEAGKNYYLWLKDSASNILECAGIIPLHENGEGLYFFALDNDSPISDTRVAFFITEEPADTTEPTQPSGNLVLGSDRI